MGKLALNIILVTQIIVHPAGIPEQPTTHAQLQDHQGYGHAKQQRWIPRGKANRINKGSHCWLRMLKQISHLVDEAWMMSQQKSAMIEGNRFFDRVRNDSRIV